MTKLTMMKMIDGKKVRAVLEVKLETKTPCSPYATTDHTVVGPDHRYKELSICGQLSGGGYSSGGQCIDEIAKLFSDDPNVLTIHRIWKRYHLNGMRAACIHQKSGEGASGQVCESSGYKYGSSWLFEEIPADVLGELQTAIESLKGAPVPTHAEDFAKNNNIEMSYIKTFENPHMKDGKAMNHYQVKLVRRFGMNQSAEFVTHFSMGLAHKKGPTLNDVLPCLAMDAASSEQSFEEFCDNMGLNQDSRSDKKIYSTIVAQAKALKSFLGKSYAEFLEIQE